MPQGKDSNPSDGESCTAHDIWKVPLKSGFSYFLDLTCVQYGYSDPAVPWDEYAQTRCTEIRTWASGFQLKGFEYRSIYLSELQPAITKWEQDNKMEIKELFELPASVYDKKKTKLLKSLRSKMEEVGRTANPAMLEAVTHGQRFTGTGKKESSKIRQFLQQRLAAMEGLYK